MDQWTVYIDGRYYGPFGTHASAVAWGGRMAESMDSVRHGVKFRVDPLIDPRTVVV